jgi:S-DNA-T family DNA segregation ATPase FtsK/SpoIIIE
VARPTSARLELEALHRRIAEAADRIHEALAVASGALDTLSAEAAGGRRDLTDSVAGLTAAHPHRFAAWDAEGWADWRPQPEVPPELRIGWFPDHDGIPATIPTFDEHPIVVVTESAGGASRAHELLRALAVRAAVELGDRVVLHLLDPHQGGFGFPERPVLHHDAPASGDPARDLAVVVEAGRDFTRRHEGVRFRDLEESERLNAQVHVVVALDFPHGYGYDAVESLNEVARLGPAGIQLIVHHDLTGEGRGGDLAFTAAHVVDVDEKGAASGLWGAMTAQIDGAAPATLVAEIASRTPRREEPSAGVGVPIRPEWSDILGAQDGWWKESARLIARARIGTLDDGSPLELRFGQEESTSTWYGQSAVAGTTRTGKSFLVHATVLSLATRYRPDELRFYIFDGQDGVTSQSYVDLPHADIVSMRTPLDMLRAAVADVRAELSRRNALATEAGVDTISRYWDVMGGVAGMPRLIVVLEEYQSLLVDDQRGVIETALKEITSTGQKFGVHLLLVSQRFGVSGLVGTQGLFANIDTRISMRLEDKEVQTAPFGKDGRALVAALAGPEPVLGRVVINDALGSDPGSRSGMIASFGDEARALDTVNSTAGAIAAYASAHGVDERPVVLDGSSSPSAGSSRQFAALAALASGTAPDDWDAAVQSWATSPARDGGLGQAEWRGYLRPVPLIVGRRFDVFGAAAIRLDREAAQNLLMVGSAPELLAGVAASAVVSAALASRTGKLEVVVLSETPKGGSWDGVFTGGLAELLGRRGQRLRGANDPAAAGALLDEVVRELDRRLALDSTAQAQSGPYLIVAIDPDRIAALRAAEQDRFSDAQPELRLGRLLREGPELGMHVILGFSGLNALRRVLPDLRKQRRLFAHKLMGQLSVTDSRELLEDDFGAKIAGAQPRGPRRFGYRDDVNEASRYLLLPYSSDGDLVATLSPFLEAGA